MAVQTHPNPPDAERFTWEAQCGNRKIVVSYHKRRGFIAEAPSVLVDGKRVDAGDNSVLALATKNLPVDQIHLVHCGWIDSRKGIRIRVIYSKSWAEVKGIPYFQSFNVRSDGISGPFDRE
jgi:hypothetical protein